MIIDIRDKLTHYEDLQLPNRHIYSGQNVYVLCSPIKSELHPERNVYHFKKGMIKHFSVSRSIITKCDKIFIVKNDKWVEVSMDFIFTYAVKCENYSGTNYVKRKNLYFEDEFEMLQKDIEMLNKVLQIKRKQQEELKKLTNKLKNKYNWDYDNFYTQKIK